MLAIFVPTLIVESVGDISLSTLASLQVKALFVDVDNTLAHHGSPEPFAGSIEWAQTLKVNGYKVVIISNNYKKRVKSFAAKYDLPFISFAKKPFPFGFNKAKKLTGIKNLNNEQCLVVGDQIFTDIVGANICGMKSVLLDPVSKEKGVFLKIKRKLDENLRNKIKCSS